VEENRGENFGGQVIHGGNDTFVPVDVFLEFLLLQFEFGDICPQLLQPLLALGHQLPRNGNLGAGWGILGDL
jgi:hypothetical protein